MLLLRCACLSCTFDALAELRGLWQLNRTVSDGVLKGIETGESVTEQVKEAAAPLADKVKDIAGDAKTQASQSGADVKNVAQKAA